MSLVFADRIKETTTTTGTGTLTLAGAVTDFRAFSTIGDGNTCYYLIDDGVSSWEVGLGTYTLSSNTLARTSVLSSSNGNSLVSFGSGSKTVRLDVPASWFTAIPSSSITGLGTLATLSAAPAGTLTGTTLAANVVATSVTSVGTIATGTWQGTPIANGFLANAAVANLSGTNTGDQTTVSGNAGSATVLATPRAINGVNFDGSAPITVTAAAGTLTGTTLASNVVSTSITSVGTLASGSIPYSLLTGTPTVPTGANPTASAGLSAVNGSAATFLRSDGAPALDVTIVPTWTGIHTFQSSNITTAQTDATIRKNGTLSTVSVQNQYAPCEHDIAHSWNTTATAADNFVEFLKQLRTTAGATPTGSLVWSARVSAAGSGSYTDLMTLTSGGLLGLGVTPTQILDVQGAFNSVGQIRAKGINDQGYFAADSDTATKETGYRFYKVGSFKGAWYVPASSSTVTFTNSGGSDIVFLSTSGLGVGSSTAKMLVNTSGLMTQYNNINTVSNGVPSELATIDTTGLSANVGATTLYAVPASGAGLYRVSAYVVETVAGNVSSTLPNVQVVYTDSDSNTSITLDVTPVLGVAGIGQTGALTANTVGTAASGVVVIYAKLSTNISYQTVNYASTAAGMTYALRIKLECL